MYSFTETPREQCSTAKQTIKSNITYRAAGCAHHWLARVVFGEAEINELDARGVTLALQHEILGLDISKQ